MLNYLQISAVFLTAFATVALVFVTVVLARATKRMARASSQPLVTATIEPNVWSMIHCDFVVQNSGNAPAFDVQIEISPEPTQSKHRQGKPLPLQAVSVLRAGQKMTSFLAEANDILDQEFRIEIRWKRDPNDESVESIAYDHHLPKEISRLGAWSPEIQIAEQVKKLREDWSPVASGNRKLSVNAFGKSDRDNERKRMDKLHRSKDSSNK